MRVFTVSPRASNLTKLKQTISYLRFFAVLKITGQTIAVIAEFENIQIPEEENGNSRGNITSAVIRHLFSKGCWDITSGCRIGLWNPEQRFCFKFKLHVINQELELLEIWYVVLRIPDPSTHTSTMAKDLYNM